MTYIDILFPAKVKALPIDTHQIDRYHCTIFRCLNRWTENNFKLTKYLIQYSRVLKWKWCSFYALINLYNSIASIFGFFNAFFSILVSFIFKILHIAQTCSQYKSIGNNNTNITIQYTLFYVGYIKLSTLATDSILINLIDYHNKQKPHFGHDRV